MGDELRRLSAGIEMASFPGAAAGECSPPIDVVETATAVEVILDVPGVAADDVQVIFARNTLVVAGRKRAGNCLHGQHGEAAFHLAERTFGRFARAVQLNGAFDAGKADAELAAGELRITLPRLEERRGREIRIPIRNL